MVDGVLYEQGETLDVYWPLAEACVQYGIAEDPKGSIPTGERDVERLAQVGIFVERRRSRSHRRRSLLPTRDRSSSNE